MKFKCVYEDINRAFLSIAKVNVRNSLFPIMELIHIEASDDQITFRATNLEIIVETTINAKVEVKGKFVINYANIGKIVNIVKNDILDIELIDNMLHISSGKSKVKLQIGVYEDIPHLPIIDQNKNTKINFKKDGFVNSIKQVNFAVANTEIKPEISSIYLYNKNEYIYTVATDTFRLAEYRTLTNNLVKLEENNTNEVNNVNYDNLNQELNLLIPGKNINILLPILDNLKDENLILESYEDGIMINGRDTVIALRTINGNFPDYVQLFPKEWLGIISVDKSALAGNLTATTLFKDSYSYSNIKIKENILYISTTNNNIGSYESEIEIQNYNLEKGEIVGFNKNNINANDQVDLDEKSFMLEASYNSSLLLDGLNKMNGNKTKLFFTTPNRPMFIKSESNNDFTYLIMPLSR